MRECSYQSLVFVQPSARRTDECCFAYKKNSNLPFSINHEMCVSFFVLVLVDVEFLYIFSPLFLALIEDYVFTVAEVVVVIITSSYMRIWSSIGATYTHIFSQLNRSMEKVFEANNNRWIDFRLFFWIASDEIFFLRTKQKQSNSYTTKKSQRKYEQTQPLAAEKGERENSEKFLMKFY